MAPFHTNIIFIHNFILRPDFLYSLVYDSFFKDQMLGIGIKIKTKHLKTRTIGHQPHHVLSQNPCFAGQHKKHDMQSSRYSQSSSISFSLLKT